MGEKTNSKEAVKLPPYVSQRIERATRWFKPRYRLARIPLINRRAARVLVLGALIIKLLLTVWNANVFDNAPYDFNRHKARAASAGLKVSRAAYDPPLYYLPCLPYVEDIEKQKVKKGVHPKQLLAHLKHTNIPYLFLFYITWICFLIPRLITKWKPATIASLVLLGFPGFQKAGVQTHPDVLLLGLSAPALAYWLWLRDRKNREGWRDWVAVAGFGLVVGLVGWTRPFAAAPVVALWIAGVVAISRRRKLLSAAVIGRVLLFTALAAPISSAWYMYRWKETGTLGGSYNMSWTGRFLPYREKFDFEHYFLSFYFWQLFEEPNLKNKHFNYTGKPRVTNDIGNSFATLAYSEFWGDQWLYFSSSKWRTEEKKWPKRILFLVALPMLPLMGWRFLMRMFLSVKRLIKKKEDADVHLVPVIYVLLACAMYFYWLTGDALMPGVHTPIKFLYNAHIVPVWCVACFMGSAKHLRFNTWLIFAVVVFMVAFPVATFWPRGWPVQTMWDFPLYR